jgi:hypothetical protein
MDAAVQEFSWKAVFGSLIRFSFDFDVQFVTLGTLWTRWAYLCHLDDLHQYFVDMHLAKRGCRASMRLILQLTVCTQSSCSMSDLRHGRLHPVCRREWTDPLALVRPTIYSSQRGDGDVCSFQLFEEDYGRRTRSSALCLLVAHCSPTSRAIFSFYVQAHGP